MPRSLASKRRRCLVRDRDGNALVEFALILPVLLLLMTGAYDFSRMFFEQQRLNDAVEAGAVYGAQSASDYTDSSDIQATVLADANATASSVTVNSYECVCNSGVLSSPNNCASSSFTCPSATTATYVYVTAAEGFTTLVHYPFTTPNRIFADYSAPVS